MLYQDPIFTIHSICHEAVFKLFWIDLRKRICSKNLSFNKRLKRNTVMLKCSRYFSHFAIQVCWELFVFELSRNEKSVAIRSIFEQRKQNYSIAQNQVRTWEMCQLPKAVKRVSDGTLTHLSGYDNIRRMETEDTTTAGIQTATQSALGAIRRIGRQSGNIVT